MNIQEDRYVRFEDWRSEKSFGSEPQSSSSRRWLFTRKPSLSSMIDHIRQGYEKGSERMKSLKRSLYIYPKTNRPAKELDSKKRVIDPQGAFIQKWNKIFVFSCIIALSLDPLFFYIPVIDNTRKCLDLDETLQIVACILRSITDIFYILHIILQFRTGFIAPCRVFGRGELIEDLPAIAKRYICSYFFIDVLAVLPFPQVVILIIIPRVSAPTALVTKDLLKIAIFSQYVPRLIRIYPLYKEVTRTSGLFTETAWAGAAFNLFLYMLASNVAGAFWYLFSIEREDSCWRIACGDHDTCNVDTLYCGVEREGDYSFLNTSCPPLERNEIKSPTDFDFGIFLDALRSRIVEKRNFLQKLFYCFWWGLRNLSSVGQNLQTSNYIWENLFAVAIAIGGLILFSLLIGNMQKYLQSITVRLEEMRVKRRDEEQWMSHRMLPDNIRDRIRRYEQYKWQETRGVEEDKLIQNLPKDLRRDINRHLCLALLTRVPIFEEMDDQLLDALCDRLKLALYTQKSCIIREGDPVDEMLFVMRGNLLTTTTNGGRTGFFNSVYLKAGDFCGEELLTWALDPNSSTSLPTSTRTVQAVTDVEAFALKADDLKFVAGQFRRLRSKELQHTFRFYSQQWRTWAACFVQAAWRRHCKKKLEKSLREEEDRLQGELAKGGNPTSLAATIYASKFAANALSTLRRNHPSSAKLSPRLPPLLLQKPAEPDFSSER